MIFESPLLLSIIDLLLASFAYGGHPFAADTAPVSAATVLGLAREFSVTKFAICFSIFRKRFASLNLSDFSFSGT